MILAMDTSSAACTVALFEGGECVASRDEVIGRGHSERLVPLVGELLDGRAPEFILVGVGPGSFTGIRVGIAAAQGMATGWGAQLAGMSSLALIAMGAEGAGEIAVAVSGGHGELVVQQFGGAGSERADEFLSLPPGEAAQAVHCAVVAGSGARALVEARGWGDVVETLPRAAHALRLPQPLRSLAPRPLYARAPDAKVREFA